MQQPTFPKELQPIGIGKEPRTLSHYPGGLFIPKVLVLILDQQIDSLGEYFAEGCGVEMPNAMRTTDGKIWLTLRHNFTEIVGKAEVYWDGNPAVSLMADMYLLPGVGLDLYPSICGVVDIFHHATGLDFKTMPQRRIDSLRIDFIALTKDKNSDSRILPIDEQAAWNERLKESGFPTPHWQDK